MNRLQKRCHVCGKPIMDGTTAVTMQDGETTKHYHGDCFTMPEIKIRGLRWTLEARLLAAMIYKTGAQEIVITEAEMEAVDGMQFLPSKEKTFRLKITPK